MRRCELHCAGHDSGSYTPTHDRTSEQGSKTQGMIQNLYCNEPIAYIDERHSEQKLGLNPEDDIAAFEGVRHTI